MGYEIEEYYARIDSGRLDDATKMLAADVEFVMALPTGVNRDSGRAAMLAYLSGRPKVDRKHRLVRVAADGDTQFAYGDVTEHGGTLTGHFLGAMHLDRDGLIDRYQVSFIPDHALVPQVGDIEDLE
ncbi:nuclear transport factor 2 family protein [Nocardia brevicatena]|uniref:nuclear transport factor 2 family protein n=1 Tax=Nocardia brevicatena TaxID=37327 RepID=UPI0002FBCC83|nr:nuclear transport factor 2 family protein [Nocardia brevicatena]